MDTKPQEQKTLIAATEKDNFLEVNFRSLTANQSTIN